MPLPKVFRRPAPIQVNRSLSHHKLTTRSLTQQQIHIWEHAALLYHWYDWQVAADAFENLAQNIAQNEQRSLCLLNIGLIEGRLGNLNKAVNAFGKAATLNPTLHIAYWLSAGIHCTNAEYDKAEAYIEICLEALGKRDISYQSKGLDFMLTRTSLWSGLRAIRTAQLDTVSGGEVAGRPVILDGLPAELIFEAPVRAHSRPISLSQSFGRRKGFSYISETTIASEQIAELRLEERTSMEAQTPASPYWLHSMRSSSSPLHVYQHGLSYNEIGSKAELIPPESSLSRKSSKTESTSTLSRRFNGWTRRPSTPFTPRDARTDSESTRELAKFIRNGGQARPAQLLSPKDARREYESLEELAQFLRYYAPDRASVIRLDTVHTDPQPPLEPLRETELSLAVKGSTESSPAADSVFSHSGVYHAESSTTVRLQSLPELSEYARLYSDANVAILESEESDFLSTLGVLPSASSIQTPTTKQGSPMLSPIFLQPTIYRPPDARDEAPSDNGDQTPNRSLSIDSDEALITTASTSDGLYRGIASPERRVMARLDTLQALEGTVVEKICDSLLATKALPPLPFARAEGMPSSPETSDSISTLDFFDKVLERSKKP